MKPGTSSDGYMPTGKPIGSHPSADHPRARQLRDKKDRTVDEQRELESFSVHPHHARARELWLKKERTPEEQRELEALARKLRSRTGGVLLSPSATFE